MNLTISGHHLEVTPELREYVLFKLDRVIRHYDQVVEMFRRAGATPRLIERSVAFDPTQRVLRDGHTVGLVGEGMADGLADWLRWAPVAGPVDELVTQIVFPEGELPPVTARFEEVAATVAEAAGWLTSAWEASENNRRAKYYRLTKAGRRQLGEETAQWNRIALAMSRALEA